ncbi:hypothetical protein IscW_ISCW017867 [Ixodes scapularis]|uniref:Uncharacterized protein n=1 Tax=Ixodes scapularis TaxID=6945 RepID=B7PH89_IXOSC|nr:hypothetical protein IscW_ISCW017867 [Ixodes scapularis]|eukprot:XP_002402355.1 hypothetical protein IscW_ISCW017867 [Ixodes scapularis]
MYEAAKRELDPGLRDPQPDAFSAHEEKANGKKRKQLSGTREPAVVGPISALAADF